MTEKILLPIIAGPTACSKTEMGIKLALHMGGEIVGADSRQIYKHLDIGTAKPTMMERNLVPYHMIDFVELDQEYNVADYVQDSSGKILEIQSSSHIPILCGGTGLYIRRLIQGIFTIPEVGKEIRSQLQQLIHLKGMDYMYDQLMIVDPETASRLNKNDHIRIIRALEVYHSTGMTISKLQKHHTAAPLQIEPIIFILTKTRKKLYEDIYKRLNHMVAAGLIEEVENIMQMGYDFTLKSLSGLGYNDIANALQKKITMEQAFENVKLKTCQYAKRQLTWFRKETNAQWITVDTKTQFDEGFQSIIDQLKDYYDKNS